ncbi:Peptidoglycan/LPS O-acetylase OafA/YrhL, contains acyltransferase and SGNH-hydrolase domains [Chitinophaga sancti]|uniref:Peptidoglycan/LPS O-acetylase OafA/YrhL, contains acyltransferase and SGNH-hydrolase domains n=2 Tax=Chitinophaga sancti TaxID=1004 RepID=A0A1K1LMU9_9BACT|nr:Peptidoglycan/LPS O-acetylase OafA/YrhL, contains acyltransferase and SGNH-hydrolase domains [Chitinophaga sancti]
MVQRPLQAFYCCISSSFMASDKPSTLYFFSLDAIRGFAALIVVLCHWQFFFYKDYTVQTAPLEDFHLPLYSLFSILYHHAFYAVDLFFLLSGFIFFWFYAEKIAKGTINFNYFITYRFTRLYPVHVLSLLAIIPLQMWMVKQSGHTFIIQNNDYWHFLLNLLVIHSWGFEKTPALNGFNGPSWSVSVELLLYLLFFLLAWRRQYDKKGLLILIVIAGAVIQAFYPMIGQGIYSFFLGALVYHIYSWLCTKKDVRKLTRNVAITAALLWCYILLEYYFSFSRQLFFSFTHKALPAWTDDNNEKIFYLATNTFFRTIVSPVTVLALAMAETIKSGIRAKWTQVLGNASYCLYLIHFPLMVASAVLVNALGLPQTIFQSPLTLLIFYIVLITLSILGHYYFELPVQQTLRQKLIKKRKSTVPAAIIPEG